jgi:hypothetical protein
MHRMLLGKEKERGLASEVRDNEFRAGETHRPERRGQVRIKTLPPDRSEPGVKVPSSAGRFSSVALSPVCRNAKSKPTTEGPSGCRYAHPRFPVGGLLLLWRTICAALHRALR